MCAGVRATLTPDWLSVIRTNHAWEGARQVLFGILFVGSILCCSTTKPQLHRSRGSRRKGLGAQDPAASIPEVQLSASAAQWGIQRSAAKENAAASSPRQLRTDTPGSQMQRSPAVGGPGFWTLTSRSGFERVAGRPATSDRLNSITSQARPEFPARLPRRSAT